MKMKNGVQNGIAVLLKVALLATVLSSSSCSSLGNRPLTDARVEAYRVNERQLIDDTIPNEERRAGIADLLSERDLLIEREIVSLCTHAQNIRRLNENYHASRDQYSVAFASYNNERRIVQREYVKVIAGIKKLTTDEEWRPIAKYQQTYLNAQTLTLERVVGGNKCS